MIVKKAGIDIEKVSARRLKDGNLGFGALVFCVFALLAVFFLSMWPCMAAEKPGNPVSPERDAFRPDSLQQGNLPAELEGIWDPNKYIGIDEVRPGMEAYCLTVYKDTEIEKFGLEVLSVVRDIWPGRNAILVQGTDERFIHTGPVGGCSGSPVYIDGRLAGALAFGWVFSKDPLYGVTPLEEMLRVGQPVKAPGEPGGSGAGDTGPEGAAFAFDFSRPVDLAEAYRQIVPAGVTRQQGLGIASGTTRRFLSHLPSPEPLPCPIVASGLPQEAVAQLDLLVRPFGAVAVSGLGGGSARGPSRAAKLVPGGCLSVPLVTGDIKLDVIGTVTEVIGDKVYGFGHHFLGVGPVDLPMATAQVHTVVSNVLRSFKFSSSLEIVGALQADESAAIYGQIGAEARMIDLKLTVQRYNDPHKRVYNCRVADNRRLTPILLYTSLFATANMRGSLPPEHTIEYKTVIETDGADPVVFENVSTGRGLAEMMTETVGPVAMIMNNPYDRVGIKSIEHYMRIMPKSTASHIWSVELSDSRVKAGERFDVSVVVESHLAEKKKYSYSFRIPEHTRPGTYELTVCGGYGYLDLLKRAVPYRFIPENLSTLVKAINDVLQIRRDRLYCLLVLPAAGVALERAELPDLPATRVLVLQDAKRTLKTQPYPHWLEQSCRTGTIVSDTRTTRVTVEK